MSTYAYIQSFFKSILDQSKTIQGRFYVLPKGGSELNTDEFDQVLKLADGKNKFPACAMMPPRSSGVYGSTEEWETYRFTLFFLNTTYYTNNQVNRPNPLTQTSSHTVIEDWDEMKVAATDFLRVINLVQRGKNSDSTILINSVFRMGNEKRFIDPVSFTGTSRLSGVKLEFEASLNLGCIITDYLDGGMIVLPPSSTGSFDTDLIVVRNEVLNIITQLGLDQSSSPGGGSIPVDTILPVTSNGQTLFNIFIIPTQLTELNINGVKYFKDASYVFETNGGNAQLRWLNEFPISTTDKIIFRKF